MRPSERDDLDLLRSIGGLLLAAGAVALLIRKSEAHEWGTLAHLLVVLIPTVTLYLMALGRFQSPAAGRPSQAVLLVTAILLCPLVLLEFLDLLGVKTIHPLYTAGIFTITGLLAGFAAQRVRAPYAVLLAALTLLVAWLVIWGQILHHPSAGIYRWLLIAAAVLLLGAAARLAQAKAVGAGELITAAGFAAVSAGVLGVIVGSTVGVVQGIPGLALGPGKSDSGSSPHFQGSHASGLQHFGWDLYLLVASLAFIWLGTRTRTRGSGYVGGIGLLAFVISVGTQITQLQAGHPRSSALVGWPLVLLILGLAALLGPLLRDRSPAEVSDGQD